MQQCHACPSMVAGQSFRVGVVSLSQLQTKCKQNMPRLYLSVTQLMEQCCCRQLPSVTTINKANSGLLSCLGCLSVVLSAVFSCYLGLSLQPDVLIQVMAGAATSAALYVNI